jgi:uncharacterized protein (TIGR02001 family)
MASKHRVLGAACASAIAILALSGPAAAEEFEWSFTLGGTSDYVYRGVSQNDNDPAMQGSFDIGYGIFYAGVWASHVDENFVATNTEIDVYVGVKPEWGKFAFDFAVLGYFYPNQIFEISGGLEVNYVEFKAGVTYNFSDSLSAGVAYYYTPDYSFELGKGDTVEGNVAYVLPKCWIFEPTINAVLGYQKVENVAFPADAGDPDVDGDGFPESTQDDIIYWNAGLTLAVENFSLDFRYWDSDIDNELTDERFVFSAKVTIP